MQGLSRTYLITFGVLGTSDSNKGTHFNFSEYLLLGP